MEGSKPSNSKSVIASRPERRRVRCGVVEGCEAISSVKQGIASTEDRRLAMTLSKFRIAAANKL
jgi:hypothetical protein